MSHTYFATDIRYDTDGEAIDLPHEIQLPFPVTTEEDADAASDYITEATGFCHLGFAIVCKTEESSNEVEV